jgi:site-specific DNA-methyltransferase (adenine-specific)
VSVRIIVADYCDTLASFEDESIDAIVTDPPYGETSLCWDCWPLDWPMHVRRCLKRSGSMWVFGSQRMFWDHRDEFEGWSFAQDVIWEKHNGSSAAADRFRRVHEIAVQFYRSDAIWGDVYRDPQFTNDATARAVRRKQRPAQWGDIGTSLYRSEDGGPRLMRSVIYARSEHGRAEHPTQKPIGIVEPLLLYATPVGGCVLDLFAGSGTTGIVAKRHGRSAILIEKNPEYAAIAERRIYDDSPLFAEVAAE